MSCWGLHEFHPNYKARTPRVGERYVVPYWVSDRKAWHDAMDEVLNMLGESIPNTSKLSTGRLKRSLPKGGSGVSILVEVPKFDDPEPRYVEI